MLIALLLPSRVLIGFIIRIMRASAGLGFGRVFLPVRPFARIADTFPCGGGTGVKLKEFRDGESLPDFDFHSIHVRGCQWETAFRQHVTVEMKIQLPSPAKGDTLNMALLTK